MRKSLHKSIYKDLSEKFDLPVSTIEKICDSQFEFTRSVMMEGEDKPVRLQYLGKFEVKPGRRETVRKRIEKMKKIHEEAKQKKQRNSV